MDENMNLKDEYDKKVKEKIQDLLDNQQRWNEWMDIDFPDEWNFDVVGNTYGNNIRISCPFNRTMYPVLQKHMEDLGYKINKYLTNLKEDGEWYPYMSFTKDKSPVFEFVFFDFNEGSVCKRKCIGETTKKVLVYEFVCE